VETLIALGRSGLDHLAEPALSQIAFEQQNVENAVADARRRAA